MTMKPPPYNPNNDPLYFDNNDFKYILKYRKPIPCRDILKWARWYENFPLRRVRILFIGEFKISTVFLALSSFVFDKNERPLLFETMIFYKGKNNHIHSLIDQLPVHTCTTWRKALKNHQLGIKITKQLIQLIKDNGV